MKNYAPVARNYFPRIFCCGLDAAKEMARIQGNNADIQSGWSFEEPVKNAVLKTHRR